MNSWNYNRNTVRVAALGALGIAMLLISSVTASVVWSISETLPVMLFLGAIAVNTWYGGLISGLFVTVASVAVFNVLGSSTIQSSMNVAILGDSIVLGLSGVMLSSVSHARQSLQTQLEETKAQLEIVRSHSGCGIIMQDAAEKVVYANFEAAKMCGFHSSQELLNATQKDILEQFEIFDKYGDPFPLNSFPGRLALLGMRYPEALLKYRIRASGEERWAHIKARPVMDRNGNVKFAINMIQDVTGIMRGQ